MDLIPSHSRQTLRRTASDRSFGVVFTIFLTMIALWPLIDAQRPRGWALLGAGLFALASIVRPSWLGPLNRVWTRIGLLMHRVTNPIVLTLIFWLTIVPTALALRLLGRRPLQLERDPSCDSYWIRREPPGPAPGSMQRRF